MNILDLAQFDQPKKPVQQPPAQQYKPPAPAPQQQQSSYQGGNNLSFLDQFNQPKPQAQNYNPFPGLAPPPTAQQQQNLANASMKAPPQVATSSNPLITKNQGPSNMQSGQNSQQVLEGIAMKQYKNEPLTDSEVKFQIQQQLNKYQGPQAVAKNMAPAPKREQFINDDYYNAAMKRYNMNNPAINNAGLMMQGPALSSALPAQVAASNPVIAQQMGGQMFENQFPNQSQQEDYSQYYQQPPQMVGQGSGNSGDFSMSFMEKYMNATPEEQIALQAQAFDAQSAKQMGMLNSAYDQMGTAYDNQLGRQQGRFDEEKKTQETQNKELIDAFKAEQTTMDKEAIAQVQKAGAQRAESTKDMQSFSGFGRSSKTMELLDNVGAETQNMVADIERQSKRSVNEYQVSLLDKTQRRLDSLRDRMDLTMDQKDAVAVKRVEAQLGLMQDLFKQDPRSPQNMIATAEKLTQVKMDRKKQEFEEMKFAAEQDKDKRSEMWEQYKFETQESRQIKQMAQGNFQFMVSNFGSGYINNLSPDQKDNLAYNLDLPQGALDRIGTTLKEADQFLEQYKYDKTYQYNALNDQVNRENQWRMLDANHQNDLSKMGVSFKQDLTKEGIKMDYENQKMAGKYQALGYGNLPPGGGMIGNGAGIAYPQGSGAVHPANKMPIVACNPALVNAYPPGTIKGAKTGPNGLGGQCAYEATKLANVPRFGMYLKDKKANLATYVKQGKGFYPGQGSPQPGDAVIFDVGTQAGHVAVVNAVTAKGEIVLSEFNWPKKGGGGGPLAFSNSRTIPAAGKGIVGFIRAGVRDQYKADPKMAEKIKAEASAKGLSGVPETGISKEEYAKIMMQNNLASGQAFATGGADAQKKMLESQQKFFQLPQAQQRAVMDNMNLGQALAQGGQEGWQDEMSQQGLRKMFQPPAEIYKSPEALASFVQQNGLSDLQQYDWWNKNPNKQAAWAMMQGGGGMKAAQGTISSMFGFGNQQQQQPQGGGYGMQQQGGYGAQQDPYAMMGGQNFAPQQMQQQQLSPFRQAVQSGSTQLNDTQEMELMQYNPGAYQQYMQDKMMGSQMKFQQQSSLKPMTEGQGAAATYATRLKQAMDVFDSLEGQGFNLADPSYISQRATPANFMGISLGGAAKSDEMKAQEQAESNFITAILRKESGASISPTEFEKAAFQYFPQPGDTPAVLMQKKGARAAALYGMLNQSGSQGQQYYNQFNQFSQQFAPQQSGNSNPVIAQMVQSSPQNAAQIQAAAAAGYSPEQIMQFLNS